MHARGHKGIALLLYAPITFYLLDSGQPLLAIGGLAIVLILSMLPDKDMVIALLTHRGPTHTIWFALLVGAVAAGFGYALQRGFDMLGIVAVSVPVVSLFCFGCFSVLAHIFGDSLTPSGVRPYKPISDKKHSFDVAKSNSFTANWFFYLVGVGANGLVLWFWFSTNYGDSLPLPVGI